MQQVKEKQSEIVQLLVNFKNKDRNAQHRREQEQEASQERIKTTLKQLERKLSQFTKNNQKHEAQVLNLAEVTPESRVRNMLQGLTEIQKSAQEYLSLNTEPRASEGRTSLITVDECLATQAMESDGLNTFRQ